MSEPIDWERVRIDAAIAAMQVLMRGEQCDYLATEIAETAVQFAFELVHELRQTEGNMPAEVKRRVAQA